MTHFVKLPTGAIMPIEIHQRALAMARKVKSGAWLSMLLPAIPVSDEEARAAQHGGR